MRVDDFDFELPDRLIALRPAVPRDSSRLLVVNAEAPGELRDDRFCALQTYLKPGDTLVFNDTKVIPAHLEGKRLRDGNIARFQATLHMRTAPDRWQAFVKGAKKLAAGDKVLFGDTLKATVGDRAPTGDIAFSFNRSGADLDAALAQIGHIPLPPYIASKRADDEQDRQDYQTVYARQDGAVAAPTAGLHFTPSLIEQLRASGISTEFVTLHVGAGTFLPVKADDTADHVMHSEIGHIDADVAARLNVARQDGGRVVAVGTTSLRLLESAADQDGKIRPWSGETDIFITPGYRFRAVDALITNFHLPRSTLFMLVCAFAGTTAMKNAYDHATAAGYRFYSYGDSSLLFAKAR